MVSKKKIERKSKEYAAEDAAQRKRRGEEEANQEQSIESKKQKRREEISTGSSAARESANKEADQLLNNPQQGYTPQQKQAMQQTAYSNINNQFQDYRRKLSAKQGMQGVRGGTAYAQQRDLSRTAAREQAQAGRDIETLDAEMAIKKIAARLALQEGRVNEYLLNQQSINQLEADERQRYRELEYEKKFAPFLETKKEKKRRKFQSKYMQRL